MPRKPTTPWPTKRGSVFYAGSASPATISRAVKQGRIRRLAQGVYSADLTTPPQDLVDGNRWSIISQLVPDAVIADRSAANDGRPTEGFIFIISNQRTTDVKLPGLTISPRPGGEPLDDDPPWSGDLRITSDARTLVENLALTKGRAGRPARTLSRSELEDWLVRKDQLRPAGWLRDLRARATEVAAHLGVPERQRGVEDIIGAVGGTRPVRSGAGRLLSAREVAREWDPERIRKFEQLAEQLATVPADPDVPTALPTPQGDLGGTLPFFEAYFSNFIEGNEFTVEEAEAIVASGDIPAARPEDAHDVLGTFQVVSDPLERATVPQDPEALLGILRRRHALVMGGRPDKRPGEFKDRRNQVGTYVFVEPDLVEGTLVEGFKIGEGLEAGFQRAMFQMFLISEVHPFNDGNGRVARAAMCAELSAVDQSRILIPIVFRNEYLAGLRLLSRGGMADACIRTSVFAWRWTAAMPWTDRATTRGRLEATNALMDSTDAERSGVRLELP